jgi:DNA polymerase delta subunit 1
MHYSFGRKTDFLKITTNGPKQVASLRRVFESGFTANGIHIQETTYESNIPFALRFMIDRNISGMSWIEIPPDKYSLRISGAMSNCQIEVDVRR